MCVKKNYFIDIHSFGGYYLYGSCMQRKSRFRKVNQLDGRNEGKKELFLFSTARTMSGRISLFINPKGGADVAKKVAKKKVAKKKVAKKRK
jgi:hypothetical protein